MLYISVLKKQIVSLQKSPAYTNRHLLLHLLSVSLMVHYGFTGDFHPWQMVTATFAAVFLLFQPANLFWPLIAVGSTLTDYLINYPELSNHAVIQFFICLGVLFIVIHSLITHNSPLYTSDQKTLLFRAAVFLIYFFSGFHKLNWGFLDADQSCVHYLNNYVVRVLGGEHATMPTWLTRLMQLATFFLELIVPFGLLFQRTCKWSVYALFVFHGYLFMAGFAHFASTSLFILPGCLINFNHNDDANKLIPRLKPYIIISAIASLLCFTICNWGNKKFEDGLLGPYFFTCCGIYLIAFVYAVRLFWNIEPISTSLRSIWNYKIIVPVLFIFLWGMEPYYGLSNRANMSMYSNMITMAGRDNHLLIKTKYTKLIPFEEDYVEILEMSNNVRRFIGSDYKHYYYPLITFRKRASDALKKINDPVYIRLLYKGEEIVIEDLRRSEWSQSKWYDRYFYYRPTPKKGYGVCVW